jgi:hypothetical protein
MYLKRLPRIAPSPRIATPIPIYGNTMHQFRKLFSLEYLGNAFDADKLVVFGL